MSKQTIGEIMTTVGMSIILVVALLEVGNKNLPNWLTLYIVLPIAVLMGVIGIVIMFWDALGRSQMPIIKTQPRLERTDPPDPPVVATGTMPPKPKSKNVDKKRLDGFWIVFGLMLLMILLILIGYFIN